MDLSKKGQILQLILLTISLLHCCYIWIHGFQLFLIIISCPILISVFLCGVCLITVPSTTASCDSLCQLYCLASQSMLQVSKTEKKTMRLLSQILS